MSNSDQFMNVGSLYRSKEVLKIHLIDMIVPHPPLTNERRMTAGTIFMLTGYKKRAIRTTGWDPTSGGYTRYTSRCTALVAPMGAYEGDTLRVSFTFEEGHASRLLEKVK